MTQFNMPALAPIKTDEDLLQQAKTGDRDALGELFRRHSNYAASVARQMAPNDYEDVLQDACVKATESIEQCRGAFGGWFHMIVRNQAINKYREQKRAMLHTTPMEGVNEELEDRRSLTSFDISPSSDSIANKLQTVFKALTEPQLEVIQALFAEAKESDQSAALLKRAAHRIGKTEGAVRNALFQIRRVVQERSTEDLIENFAAKADRDDILITALADLLPEMRNSARSSLRAS